MSKRITSKKLIIVDGNAMVFRAYYALLAQGLTNSKGQSTFAVYGFFRMFYKVLQTFKPSHILVVFDPAGKNFRYDIYPEYKANRSKTPEDLYEQLDEIIDILDHLHVSVHRPVNVEADDAIASFVEQNYQEFEACILISGDKDLYSILYPNVKMIRFKKGLTDYQQIDAKMLYDTLGLHIEQISDFMALTGDTADNVPGVKGVGEKTASKLIQAYGTLDKVYEQLDEIKPVGLQDKLRKDKDNAYLSFDLVELKKDLTFPFSLESLHKSSWEMEHLNVFQERNYPSLLADWLNLLDDSQTTASIHQSFVQNIRIIYSADDRAYVRSLVRKIDTICFDTETDGLQPILANLVGVSFAIHLDKKFYNVYVPIILKTPYSIHLDYQQVEDMQENYILVKEILENVAIKKIAQNAKYDTRICLNHDIHVASITYDTMLMSFLLYAGVRRSNLDTLAMEHFGYVMLSYKDLVGVGKKAKPLVEIPLEKLAFYACEDAELTYRCFFELFEELLSKKLVSLYRKIDLPLLFLLGEMEEHGVLLDIEQLKVLEKEYSSILLNLTQEIYKQVGEVFNIQSTKELQVILFDKLQLSASKKTVGGQFSTDASVLESLKEEHSVIPLLLDYRTYSKLLSTYLEPLAEHIINKTGRVHTSFSQVVASTGRLASSDPNLQNIPIRGQLGSNIRKVFIPQKDYELLSLDYSQIELRVLAHYSQDQNLLSAFRRGEDIHDWAVYLLFFRFFDPTKWTWNNEPINTQEQLLGGDIDLDILQKMKMSSKFKEKRSVAKVLNFSIVYGVTDWGLSQSLNISRELAKSYIDLYFEMFPKIKTLMQDFIDLARKKGYAENMFGRRRSIFGLSSKNRFERLAAERLAINTPVQSSAADILKFTMIKLSNTIKEQGFSSRILLQIHDELLFEVYKDEKKDFFDCAKNIMENTVQLDGVPLTVDGSFGLNWDSVK